MTPGETAIFGLMMLVGLALSAVFSGMEIGLYTLNRVRVAVLAGRGDRRAQRVRRLLGRSNRTLSTLLLGNNLANYLGSFGLAAMLDQFAMSPIQAIAVNAGILIPVIFVFGETLPKDLFRTHTDHWTYRTSGFLTFVDRLFTVTGLAPLVQGFGYLAGRLFHSGANVRTTARQRISQLIREGVGAGVLSEAQTTLADRALALRHRALHSVMEPWTRVFTLQADAPREAREETLRRRNFTRMPLVDASGAVIGIVSILDALLHPERPTRELAEPAMTFRRDETIHDALRTMRRKRRTMAIVLSERTGRPVGLITLKDLVEPLTGELTAW